MSLGSSQLGYYLVPDPRAAEHILGTAEISGSWYLLSSSPDMPCTLQDRALTRTSYETTPIEFSTKVLDYELVLKAR